MDERRKNKRLPIKLELAIDKLFKQDNEVITNMSEEIFVTDISKTGIGFYCKDELPLNYYFNAKIEFDDERFFYCVIKIIRIVPHEEGYIFGCEFVGLADFLSHKVDEYEAEIEAVEE